MKKYDEGSVARALNKVSGINVDTVKRVIEIAPVNYAGNGSWGKIDFLRKYCDYTISTNGSVVKGNKPISKIKTKPTREDKKAIKELKMSKQIKTKKVLVKK